MTDKNKKIELAKRIFHKTKIWLFGETIDFFSLFFLFLKMFYKLAVCFFVTGAFVAIMLYFHPEILNSFLTSYKSAMAENYGCNFISFQENSFPKK